jgi:hypothetical protein
VGFALQRQSQPRELDAEIYAEHSCGIHKGGHVVEEGAGLGRAAYPAKGGAEDLGIRRGQTEIIGQHVVWFAKRSFAPPVSRRWREIIPSTQNRPPDGPG